MAQRTRTTSLYDRVTYSGAVYYIDWSDVPIANPLACGFSNTQNAGEIRIVGTEWEATAAVSDAFQISGSFSYSDSEFTTDNAALGISDGQRTPTATRVKQDGYHIANARIGLGTDTWQASFFVDNLSDEHAVMFKDTVFLPHNRGFVNRPRTIGITLNADF